jgi:hypothetical protein
LAGYGRASATTARDKYLPSSFRSIVIKHVRPSILSNICLSYLRSATNQARKAGFNSSSSMITRRLSWVRCRCGVEAASVGTIGRPMGQPRLSSPLLLRTRAGAVPFLIADRAEHRGLSRLPCGIIRFENVLHAIRPSDLSSHHLIESGWLTLVGSAGGPTCAEAGAKVRALGLRRTGRRHRTAAAR